MKNASTWCSSACSGSRSREAAGPWWCADRLFAADLALPAAIAADIIPPEERGRTAGYFGIWSLINKLVLALAAGLALPLLAGLGYQPGAQTGLTALAIGYAGIPSIIKLLAVALLIRWRACLEVNHVA